ncbi:hypothetical protein AcW1_006907 [Taiwanofungus camphoratus]|nr:hypothetical protein AcW1_006907 [Antrodia cinnamomea]
MMGLPDQSSSFSNAVPFAFFVSLIHAISAIEPRKTSHNVPHNVGANPLVLAKFRKWIAELRRLYVPLPPDTTAIVFRLLFPDEDVRRKYGMKETRLARHLAEIYAVSTSANGRGERLLKWKGEDTPGCLGLEVRNILEANITVNENIMSIAQVDALLTELASTCAFSASAVRHSSSGKDANRPAHIILRDLYTPLTPDEACIVTQIILKDLRPLLYPLPPDQMHYTASLLRYNSRSAAMLTKYDAMREWDPSGLMLASYRVRASLDEAAVVYEQHVDADVDDHDWFKPQIGVLVQIPKCVKGQGCAHALKYFRESKKVWAETKYDGERAQIHVELNPAGGEPRITIFSKSGRDSTLDRISVHSIIREAIGVPRLDEPPCNQEVTTASPTVLSISNLSKVKKNVILEAEMVAYSDVLDRIDEFWRIRSLIASTAIGPRRTRNPQMAKPDDDSFDSQCSLLSNGSDGGTRHLALVFFDILLLDDVSLLLSPYSSRRTLLESVIELTPGRAMLAERSPVSLSLSASDGLSEAETQLRVLFSRLIADHQEGVVLKADEGRSNDWRQPWVKLKKDYIPGYGDTLDLVLIGAAWEKNRARELRVAPTAYTTFYLGALANADTLKTNPAILPHFEVFFTVCYGFTREKLEELNFMIKSSDPVEYLSSRSIHQLSYTYNLFPGLVPPTVLLQQPILAEVFGANFTKAPHSKFYEIRFPRISKFFRLSERSWAEGTTLQEFQKLAREAVGRDRPNKDVDDWCNDLWGKPSSPGVKCPVKRKNNENLWERRLEFVDQKEYETRTTSTGGSENQVHSLHMEHGSKERDSTSLFCRLTKTPPRIRTFGSATNVMQSNGSSPNIGKESSTALGTTSKALEASSSQPVHQLSAQCSEQEAPLGQAHIGTDTTCLGHFDQSQTVHAIPMQVSPATLNLPATENSIASTELRHYATGPMGKFLRNTVVWLARPSSSPRPSWKVPSHLIIPAGQMVHGLNCFLQACGWCIPDLSTPGCEWIQRGVVFIDDNNEDDGKQWMDYALKTLIKRRASLVSLTGTGKSKPVWVFSMKLLSFEELGRLDEDIESRAICRLG